MRPNVIGPSLASTNKRFIFADCLLFVPVLQACFWRDCTRLALPLDDLGITFT
jgi:hypothetical protein